MIMLISSGQTLFFNNASEARKFLKISQVEYEAAFDLGKAINGWTIDETIEPIKRRGRKKENDGY